MTIWSWAGMVLIAVGLIGFGVSFWTRSHESVRNGLVLSGCLSCVLSGSALLLITGSSLSRLGLVRCYSSVAILPFSFQENPGGDLCRDLLCRNGLARIL